MPLFQFFTGGIRRIFIRPVNLRPVTLKKNSFTAKISLLKDISDLSVTHLSERIIYRKIVELTSKLLEVNKCSLVMEDKNAVGAFKIKAAEGLNVEVIEKTVIRAGEGIAGHVALSGKPLLVKDIESHPLFKRKSSKKYSTVSLLAVPLKINDKTIGVLNVNNKKNGSIFTETDQFFLSIISNQISRVIESIHYKEDMENYNHIKTDLNNASLVQKQLFPAHLPADGTVEIQAENIPALELGGDLYDVIRLSDTNICFVIGDVSGKGIAAALYMSNIISKIRIIARQTKEPDMTLFLLNNYIVDESIHGNFCTLFIAFYNQITKTLKCAAAGHPPPVIRNSLTQMAAFMEITSAQPIGITKNIRYSMFEVDLKKGDSVLLYTDGVTDAKNKSGILYGFDRIFNIAENFKIKSNDIIAQINKDIENFTDGAKRTDDITMLNFIIKK